MDEDGRLAQKFAAILPHLHERQRRLLLAAEAQALGSGGIARVARAAGVSRATVHKALREEASAVPADRARRVGGGRRKQRDRDPALPTALAALVSPDTRGDPLSPLRWTGTSTRQLAAALAAQGHPASEQLVRGLLHEAGYRVPANAQTREGSRHPDRDAQFR